MTLNSYFMLILVTLSVWNFSGEGPYWYCLFLCTYTWWHFKYWPGIFKYFTFHK